MIANELRIGNYIKSSCGLLTVDAIDNETGFIYGYDTDFNNDVTTYDKYSIFKCEPIPLTEEWLLKFGEDNEYSIDISANRKKITFYWSSRVVKTGKRFGWYCKKYKHIKYIHQLQNLYFALTGEELKIN